MISGWDKIGANYQIGGDEVWEGGILVRQPTTSAHKEVAGEVTTEDAIGGEEEA